nr:uncharacterized protein LOC112008833 [Quercus suber]
MAPPYMVTEMQMMKERMDFMMNALRGRVSNHLDELVHRTNLPFVALVTSFPLPPKFRMTQIEAYDGSKDPLDHLESFKTLMHLQGVTDKIMCRAFPTTLKGPAKELSAQFVLHFIGGHRYKKSIACLMSIKQWEDETQRSYITRFNKEALSIDEANDKILVTAITNSLRKGKFLFSLYKNNPKTMLDVLYPATTYMNAEGALLSREENPKKRERQEDSRQDRGRKTTRIGDEREDRRSKLPTGRFINFTPLSAPINQVLMQIKDNTTLTWLGKLKGDPSKRFRDKYCRFHGDHGHDTSECYDLKQQIEALIRQGKLE